MPARCRVQVVTPRALTGIAAAVMAVAMTAAGAVRAQTGPAFEVATIKLNRDGADAPRIGNAGGGRWQMIKLPIRSLLLSAYPADTSEIVGMPSWVESETYDVIGKAAENTTYEQQEAMLRTLLAERFNFKGRLESLDRPIYSLVLARRDGRLGPQLRKYEGDCDKLRATTPAAERPQMPTPANGGPACGMMFGGNRILAGGIPLQMLARNITQAAGRVVFDKTGLEGRYEITLTYNQNPAAGSDPGGDTVSIFTAVQEQLGLKLEPDRGPVRILVVDHIERPTPD
jgi:uncharacterized protein (TIGR03435 family)